jgi:hypothetical protein
MLEDKTNLLGKTLSETELSLASGGAGGEEMKPIGEIVCPKCGFLNIIYPNSSNFCTNCNEQITWG